MKRLDRARCFPFSTCRLYFAVQRFKGKGSLIKTRAPIDRAPRAAVAASLLRHRTLPLLRPFEPKNKTSSFIEQASNNVHHNGTFNRLPLDERRATGPLRPTRVDTLPSARVATPFLCSFLSCSVGLLSLSSLHTSIYRLPHFPLSSFAPRSSPMVALKLTILTLLASALGASAFPHLARDLKGRDLQELEKTVNDIIKRADIKKLHADARERHRTKRAPTFSETQLVDVTGEHRFIAPTSKQTRGPCPGLNVLANHGCRFFSALGQQLLLVAD